VKRRRSAPVQQTPAAPGWRFPLSAPPPPQTGFEEREEDECEGDGHNERSHQQGQPAGFAVAEIKRHGGGFAGTMAVPFFNLRGQPMHLAQIRRAPSSISAEGAVGEMSFWFIFEIRRELPARIVPTNDRKDHKVWFKAGNTTGKPPTSLLAGW